MLEAMVLILVLVVAPLLPVAGVLFVSEEKLEDCEAPLSANKPLPSESAIL